MAERQISSISGNPRRATHQEVRERWVIRGTLVLETPAHFGVNEPDNVLDMPVLLDESDGEPLLPGASIAGALRNYLREIESGDGFPLPSRPSSQERNPGQSAAVWTSPLQPNRSPKCFRQKLPKDRRHGPAARPPMQRRRTSQQVFSSWYLLRRLLIVDATGLQRRKTCSAYGSNLRHSAPAAEAASTQGTTTLIRGL